MISRDSSLDEIKAVVRNCLNELYDRDAPLFQRNKKKGICERCIVFRFAHYLQNLLRNSFFVDCDFNSSFVGLFDEHGHFVARERGGKEIRNPDGTLTKRFVDIIVHKRNYTIPTNDLICFELKKWDNDSLRELKKDINNLKQLTSTYGYLYGFHLIFGQTRDSSKWTIFQHGQAIETDAKIYENETN